MQNKSDNARFGVDLNQYRAEVNFKVLATKVDFVYLRVSGSGSGKFKMDTKFLELARYCSEYNIPSGGYHFAVPSSNLATADSQCDDFIHALEEGYGRGSFGSLFPVIDVEVPQDRSISTDNLLDWVDRFRKRFESKTRRKLMIYTGAFFIEMYDNFKHSKKGYILSDMPLWIALYKDIPSNPPYPVDAGGWTKWRMWQFSEKGSVPGITQTVDVNWGPDSVDDLVKPRPVQNLKAYVTGDTAKVSWNKSTDTDLNGYNLFVNKEYVKTLNKYATAYDIDLTTVPRLSKGNDVVVGIESFDYDGEFSNRVELNAGRRDMRNDFVEDIDCGNFFIRYPDSWK